MISLVFIMEVYWVKYMKIFGSMFGSVGIYGWVFFIDEIS